MDFLKAAKENEDYIISMRRKLHGIPELGNELPKTVAIVEEELKKMGIPYKKLVNGNAIVGLIEGKEGGKTIALRADMDALPIKEETGLPFASDNGCMHACGHDGHTAILLGTAKVLIGMRDSLKGNVKLLFQPGEEYPGGALPMIEEGAMENPKVDAVIGLHEGHINSTVPTGSVGFCPGPAMASMDRILIKVIGKGVHGAYPEQGIDAIAVSAEIISALQKIISREIKSTDNGLISICRINGGFNQNILPDSVEMEGTVRATDEDVRQLMARRIREIAEGISAAYGARAEVTYDFKYPPLVNDREFTENAMKSAEKIIGKDLIYKVDKPIMGGEDMAYFLREAPGTFFFLQNPSEIEGNFHPHHNSKFDIDESKLHIGSAVTMQIVNDYLNGEYN